MLDTTVTVEQGALRGRVMRDRKGRKFYGFQGVPYAKPPVGNLRFKAPQPPEPWQGVRSAAKEGNECFAGHLKMKGKGGIKIEKSGSEDCLYLNVYTPQIKCEGAGKPVMFYIHGGAFINGSSSALFYGPDYLVCEDVVLVTINYRLGVLGFLCVDDPTLGVFGNAGIKDALQALRWVHTNIKQFGGDPENVTIFGQSSGGVSTHLMILSPLSKGLFNKAILQSGVSTCAWASGDRSSYKKLAKSLGCCQTEDKEILEYLQSLSLEELYKGQELILEWSTLSTTKSFAPVIERPSPEAIICEHPGDIIKSGKYNKVPIIIGHTSMEGLMTETMTLFNMPANITKSNVVLPHFYPLKPGTAKYIEAEGKVMKFYFGNAEPVPGTIPYIQAASDSIFIRETTNVAKAHIAAQKPPVYFYIFSALTSLNLTQQFLKTANMGASHSDDVPYIFRTLLATLKPGSIEELAVDRMVKMWANFAKTGDPIDNNQEVLKGVDWKPATLTEFNYLDIGRKLRVGVNPNKKRMEFWDEIFEFGKQWEKHPN